MKSLFVGPYEGFMRMKMGHYAFYCEGPTARMFLPMLLKPHELCDTRLIPFPENSLAGIVVAKFFPLRERLRINWLWMNEVGVVFKKRLYWHGWKIHCRHNSYFEEVRFQYMAILVLFLLISYILSLAILAKEIYFDKFLRKRH